MKTVDLCKEVEGYSKLDAFLIQCALQRNFSLVGGWNHLLVNPCVTEREEVNIYEAGPVPIIRKARYQERTAEERTYMKDELHFLGQNADYFGDRFMESYQKARQKIVKANNDLEHFIKKNGLIE